MSDGSDNRCRGAPLSAALDAAPPLMSRAPSAAPTSFGAAPLRRTQPSRPPARAPERWHAIPASSWPPAATRSQSPSAVGAISCRASTQNPASTGRRPLPTQHRRRHEPCRRGSQSRHTSPSAVDLSPRPSARPPADELPPSRHLEPHRASAKLLRRRPLLLCLATTASSALTESSVVPAPI
ncbi:pollen-specific leucine-rich repeat extensin-like protein 3 [Iris pallida]|uniref:Pollen-specific leucine-rich repeat extensin-like protein 3 n=1 Tax=Iris pallida TaxID=29817 RepID=A0AAX6GIQ5_IRIPA|nr:pollen-specific leucine-rich repeat extensin-like protein 3 [Iris pallida]KAJ6828413.1 pollen-specific leucine-rich repeat extensin-like protein 3 [Iris pallida]